MVNLKTDYRKVVGDNPNDITDTKYGNNNVMGPDKTRNPSRNARSRNCAQSRYNNLGGDGYQ
jgi:hypothetical protein